MHAVPSGTHNPSAYQPVRAPHGAALSCKGWQQEAVLRMLLNSLDPEVAERPQDLIISSSAGQAAADWESFKSIVASLRRLEGDETLLVESGKPASVTRAKPRSPRVLATNTAGGETFGDWLYAGTQTELPALYEFYGAAARAHFGGTLAGRLVLGAGMEGHAGAQPLAAALHGAAFLGIEADAERIKRRVKTGYCEVMVNDLDEALRMLKNAVRQRQSVSIGLIGDCAAKLAELAQRGIVPDLLTDCTTRERVAAPAAQLQALRDLEKLGTRVMSPAGDSDHLRSLIAGGWRQATWLALSGEPNDIARVDRLALDMFPGDERIQRWLPIAGKYVRFQGLPARVAWLQRSQLSELAHATNELVAQKQLSAPILFGCHSAPAELPATGRHFTEDGSCWAWVSAASVEPSAPNTRSGQAIVADGTAEAAGSLSIWPAA
jgi:urocanate hydratase